MVGTGRKGKLIIKTEREGEMEKYIKKNSFEYRHDVPEYVRQQAKAENKKVKKIVWDYESGYPEHAWGFVQWTCRPYSQGYGCDGTTDLNIHLIAIELCKKLNLNYQELYNQAYDELDEWLDEMDWKKVRKETIIPDQVNDYTLRLLLYDLNEINNRSICELLEDVFESMGYDVADWWDDEKTKMLKRAT